MTAHKDHNGLTRTLREGLLKLLEGVAETDSRLPDLKRKVKMLVQLAPPEDEYLNELLAEQKETLSPALRKWLEDRLE